MSTKLAYGSGAIDVAQVPSVSPVCVQAANNLLAAGTSASAAVAHGICIAECETLYDLIKSCFGQNSADFHFDLYCGTNNGTDCLTARYGPTYTPNSLRQSLRVAIQPTLHTPRVPATAPLRCRA